MVVRNLIRAIGIAGVFLAACSSNEDPQPKPAAVTIPGALAAELSKEAEAEIQANLVETLSNLNSTLSGDAKLIVPPQKDQPAVGAGDGAYEPAHVFRTARSLRGGIMVTSTGYVAADEAGPDGTTGWYKREYNGYTFWYKTDPAADLTQAWPSNVRTIWSGWTATDANTGLLGWTWWMRNEAVSAQHVRGEWHFAIPESADKYGGTAYNGFYEYERQTDVKTFVASAADFRFLYGTSKYEAYSNYSYTVTQEPRAEYGVYYYGRGPKAEFSERPAWTQGQNPAGDAWTDRAGRPGLYYYQLWKSGSRSWWRYDGEGRECSSAVSEVSVHASASRISVGKTVQLYPSAKNNCGETLRNVKFTYTTGNSAVATVSESGLVSGTGAGETQITVSAEEASANYTVGVREFDRKPARVYVTGGSSVQTGGSVQLSATVYNQYNEIIDNATVDWQSRNANLATVNSQGRVNGLAAGTATIRAVSGGVYADRSITVYNPNAVTSLYLSCQKSRAVAGGDAVSCTAYPYNYAGTYLSGATVTWTSTNTNVATLAAQQQTATITPAAAGTTTIRAVAGSLTRELTFTVFDQNDISYVVVSSSNGTLVRTNDATSSLALNAKAYNYGNEEIPGVSFSWSSDNYNVAGVEGSSSTATVTAGGTEGSTYIRATANGKTGVIYVTAQDNRLQSIKIRYDGDDAQNHGTRNIASTATPTLSVRGYNLNGRYLGLVSATWTVPEGATMSESGVVTFTGTGARAFTASVPSQTGGDDAQAYITFNVYDAGEPTSISYAYCSGTTLYAGNAGTCYASVINAGYYQIDPGSRLVYTSSNSDLLSEVSRSYSGGYTAISFQAGSVATGGSVTVNAWLCPAQYTTLEEECTQYGSTFSFTIWGTNDVNSIGVSAPSGTTVAKDGSRQLVATAYDYQGSQIEGVGFSWCVYSGSTFTVDETGLATATGNGNSTLRAYVGGTCNSPTRYGAITLTAQDPSVVTNVSLFTQSSKTYLQPGETIVVWAEGRNYLNDVVAQSYTFSADYVGSTYGELSISPLDATSATVTFTKVNLPNSSSWTNWNRLRVTPQTSGSAVTRNMYVYNPVSELSAGYAPYMARYADGATFQVLATVSNGYAGSPTAESFTYTASNDMVFAVDANGEVTVAHQQGESFNNNYTVTVCAVNTTYNASNCVTGPYVKVDMAPTDLSGAVTGMPALQNGTFKSQLWFMDGAQYDVAATSSTLLDVAAYVESTWTSPTRVLLDTYSGGYYGIRQVATGSVQSSNLAARVTGWVKFSSTTAYVSLLNYQGGRLEIGGITVLDQWSNTALNQTVYGKLSGIDTGLWYPFVAEGLVEFGPYSSGYALVGVNWSADGTYYYADPSSLGWQIGRDL